MTNNEELIAKLETATTKEDKGKIYGELYINNKPMICKICYSWSVYKKAEFDDLCQEAYFMLVAAADSYQVATDKSVKFLTYLKRRLNWDFIRYFTRHKHYDNEVNCLDTPLNSETATTMVDMIADDTNLEETVIDNIYNEEVVAIFLDAIKDFKPRIKDILHRVLILKHSTKAIATSSGNSPNYIRQIYKKGLQQLRAGNIRNKITAQIDRELDNSLAYRTSGYSFWKRTGMSSVEYLAIRQEEREERRANKKTDREARRAALYGND